MSEWDLLNWHAMIIELSIAGGLAVILSVFFYRRQEHQRKQIDDIIIGEDKHHKRRHDFEILRIRNMINPIKEMLIEFEDDYNLKPIDVIDLKIRPDIANYIQKIADEYEKISIVLDKSTDVLDPSETVRIQAFARRGFTECANIQNKISTRFTSQALIHEIDTILSKLPKIDPKEFGYE